MRQLNTLILGAALSLFGGGLQAASAQNVPPTAQVSFSHSATNQRASLSLGLVEPEDPDHDLFSLKGSGTLTDDQDVQIPFVHGRSLSKSALDGKTVVPVENGYIIFTQSLPVYYTIEFGDDTNSATASDSTGAVLASVSVAGDWPGAITDTIAIEVAAFLAFTLAAEQPTRPAHCEESWAGCLALATSACGSREDIVQFIYECSSNPNSFQCGWTCRAVE